MQFTNDSSRYGSVSQWLHWVTAALVIVLLVMGDAFDVEADESRGGALYFWHSSLGVLVFILAVARIGWFLFSRPPALPRSTSRTFRALARSTHIALYALLFALPVSGWLAASSEGASVPVFGIAVIPAWREAARSPPSSAAAARESKPSAAAARNMRQAQADAEKGEGGFEELHEILGNVLLALASLHVLAALKHHFVNHDDVLRRMLPRSGAVGGTPPSAREHGLM